MNSNIFMKIDSFARQHLLLTSFVCLIILSFILIYYMTYMVEYVSVGHKATIGGRLADVYTGTIQTTLIFHSLPTLAISILLSHFLHKKTHIVTLPYYKKYFLSFFPTLAIILFVLFTMPNASTFFYKIPCPYPMAILTSFVYSAVFSAFFTWLSKASKKRIIIQSIVISILMGFINKIIYEIGSSPYM